MDKIVINEGRTQILHISSKDNPKELSLQLHGGSRLCLYLTDLSDSITVTANLDRDSYLDIFVGLPDADNVSNRFDIHLDAPGAEFRLNGFVILTDTHVCNTAVTVFHHAPHCTSNQLVKYIVDDEAHGSFSGLIRVDHGAFATEAYQSNRNILAGASARMDSEPQLEIYCDDVKCSHGSATGQLDERALFYMRSRGIDLPEARSMLMNAFMADVIETIADDALRENMKQVIEQRFS